MNIVDKSSHIPSVNDVGGPAQSGENVEVPVIKRFDNPGTMGLVQVNLA